MKKLKSTLLVLLMAMVCLVLYYMIGAIGSTDSGNDKGKDNTAGEENNGNQTEDNPDNGELAEGDEQSDKVTISLVAVGDNFAHESVIESGKQDDGSYNYDFLFEGIKNEVQKADIAAIYQTMIIAGNDKGVAGYPLFNTPEEMMAAIQEAGFNLALMASNHTTDLGTDGIQSCLELWKKYENVKPLGINGTEEQSVNIPIIEIEGKRIAVLNYTYGLNYPITDSSEQYMVNYLGTLNSATGVASISTLSETVISDIERANDQADFVVVFPCWGDEYTYDTGNTVKKWAEQMTEAGADLIIGAHTHYIGEIEQITSENGNTSMCYYSLGNFCSSFNNPATMVGGMAKVNIVFDGEEVYVDTETSGIIPIVTHYTHSGNADDDMANIKGVYMLSDYTEEMASSHGIITRGGVEFGMSTIQSIIDKNVDSKYLLEP